MRIEPRLQRPAPVIGRRVCRHGKRWNPKAVVFTAAETSDQVVSGGVGHADVGNQYLRPSIGRSKQQLQRLLGRGGRRDIRPRVVESGDEQFPGVALIVHH